MQNHFQFHEILINSINFGINMINQNLPLISNVFGFNLTKIVIPNQEKNVYLE